MAWTTARTWVTDELVTASIMNTHVRDNLNHLRDVILGTQDVGANWRALSRSVVIDNGLNVGFTSAPTADQVRVGDSSFGLQFIAAAPQLTFDSGSDYISYTRASNLFNVVIAAAVSAEFSASGLRVTNGLNVGFVATPVADEIRLGDANFRLRFDGTDGQFHFDTGNDYLTYIRGSNTWQFVIGGTAEAVVGPTGIRVLDGLDVGFTNLAPVADELRIGDADFKLVHNAGDPIMQLGLGTAGVGTIRLKNNKGLVSRNGGNTADVAMISIDVSNRLQLGVGVGPSAADIVWGKPLVGLGGGAAPTLGTIGGSGPSVAAQNSWMQVVDTVGATFWVPTWK